MIGSTAAPAPVASAPTADARSARKDWIAIGLLAIGLLVFFAELYPRRHWQFGVGPDGPVYLWWSRLAALDGLSAIGTRPGVSALALVLRGSTRSSLVEALAAIGVAGGVAVGLASGALVWLGTASRPAADRRLRAVAAGALAGTFAVHLADGYLANLVQAALFLAAAALLCAGTTRAAAAAAALLAASALSHLEFFLLSAGILAAVALLTILRRPPGTRLRDVEGARVLGAVVGGGALAGIAFGSMAWGPRPLRVDTSEDAFLRRAGLGDLLRRQYRTRLTKHVARYVLPAQIPAAILGLLDVGGFLGRFLVTWFVVAVAGVAVAGVTSLVPAVRLIAFAYVMPMLAGIGLVRLYRWMSRRARAVAAVATIAVGVAVVSGAEITWNNTQPYVAQQLLARAAAAGRIAERISPPGTPLVFAVDTADRNVAFLATRATNIIRDAVPPDRIRDVYVYVGAPAWFLHRGPTPGGTEIHQRMSALYLHDIEEAGGRPLAFVLSPADHPYYRVAKLDGDVVSKGVVLLRPHPTVTSSPSDTAPPPAAPSSGWRIAWFSFAGLLVLFAIGLGWSQTVLPGAAGLALAPAFGMGAAILVGILLDRLGVPVGGWGSPAVSAIAGMGGYAALVLVGRRRRVEQARLSGP